ncbi:MAG: hypothetical protein J5806_10855 [Lentisphaeria bacterium]|nr:hypothetical protein [Lentisphaeria bacterium]
MDSQRKTGKDAFSGFFIFAVTAAAIVVGVDIGLTCCNKKGGSKQTIIWFGGYELGIQLEIKERSKPIGVFVETGLRW